METIPYSLLATKLYLPVQPSRYVPRQHLLQRLQHGLSQKQRITLISAPAGYGKTLLVVEWIREGNIPASWISLDGGDNDFVRFARYLITALRTLHPELGESCLQQLNNAQLPSVEGLLTPLVNELTELPEEKPFLLVLDDYHLINAQAIHDAITFLVEHQPPHRHLVLITRADPPLPLARWRGRGQLNELRLVDLRFDVAETEAYLDMTLKMHLSPVELEALITRSEGWIAGLQMAAASLREQDNISSLMQALSGSQRNILDYLLEEVLQHLPEDTQDFLICTSFLERLCGSLCDAVLDLPGKSQALLEGFERENLFTIPLDDHRCWYRYHHLFADLLQTRLYQRLDADKVSQLGKRACQWYESHALLPDAVELALRGQDYPLAAVLIEQTAEEMLRRGELVTFKRWIEKLPIEYLREQPTLCLYQAWALLWSGSPFELINASLLPLKNIELPTDGLFTARLLPLQAFLSLFQGDITTAVQKAQLALKELPAHDTFLRSMATIVLASAAQIQNQDDRGQQLHDQAIQEGLSSGNLLLSISMLSSLANLMQKEGRLSQAEGKYQQALDLAIDMQGHTLPIATRPLVGLASIALERNQLTNVEAQLQQAVHYSQGWGANALVNAYLILARAQECLGKLREAQETLDKARRQARQFDLTDMDDFSVEIFQQRLNLMQNDLQAVQTWTEHRGLWGIDPQEGLNASDFTNAHIRKYEYPVLARLYLRLDYPQKALEYLNALLPHVRTARRLGLVIETLLLSALALQSLKRQSEAFNMLKDAAQLAEPEMHTRLFVDDGPDLLPLMIALVPRLTDHRLVDFIEGILLSIPTYEANRHKSSPLIEPLSDRELEILRLLVDTSLSAAQIADQLCISVSTVRTHIKSIYSKLDVHGRVEAAIRSRELKLI